MDRRSNTLLLLLLLLLLRLLLVKTVAQKKRDTKAAATLQKKQEEEEVAAAAAALAAATPPTTTTAATVTPLACTTTDDPIIPVVLGFGSSDDDDFAGDFAGDGEKKKQDDTVKAIADAAVKAGTVAKETQGDEEAAFVDDDITGNGDIHPILRCEIPWDELDPTLKGHMKILGFRHYSWMGEQGDLPAQFLSPWDQLNDNLQAAAAAFGCDALSWNTWERSVFERPKLSITALESEAAKQKREEDAKKNQENDRSKADRNHYKAAPISTTKITIPAGKRILSDDLAQQFDRDRLAALWDAHAPGMRKDIEQRLEKYRGREEQMFADMAADSRDNLTRPWLEKVLTDFDPGNLPNTERILQEFLGREDELYLQHLQHHTSRTPASDDAEVDEDKEKEKPAAAATTTTTADAANANADDRLKAEATKRIEEETGTNFFLEKNWDDLPKTQQECAILLGHDKSSWNKRNKGIQIVRLGPTL